MTSSVTVLAAHIGQRNLLLVRLSLPYFTTTHIYIATLLHRSSINSALHVPSLLYVTVMSPDLPTALPNY
jgi:hypothetical protein